MTFPPLLATRLSLFVLLFLLGVASLPQTAQAQEIQKEQPFISFLSPRALPNLFLYIRQTGQEIPLRTLVKQKQAEGFSVLLHVWAPSCPPCLVEMEEIAKNFSRLIDTGIYVLLITESPPRDPALDAMLRPHHWEELPLYQDKGFLLPSLLQPRGLPVTYVVSDKKQITARKEGRLDWAALLPSEQSIKN